MNINTKKIYISYAINNIDKAKAENSNVNGKIDNLVKYIESNIQIDILKNIKSDVSKYKTHYRNSNTNLDNIRSRLVNHRDSLKEMEGNE